MKSILVPTDFSKNSANTLRYAIQFAREKKCKLVFFHSFYDRGLSKTDNADELVDLERTRLTYLLKKELKEIFNSLSIPFSAKNVEFIVKFGKNFEKTVNESIAERGIDLVIIGTHGETGLKEVLLGTNTTQLISTSKIPILAIPMRYSYKAIKKIIYSADLYNTQIEIAKLKAINELFQSRLNVVYFDNGIEKTKGELNNIKLIEKEGLIFQTVKVDIGSHFNTNLTAFIRNKVNSAVCLFHSPKKRLINMLLGSNTDELALHLKSPLLSINK